MYENYFYLEGPKPVSILKNTDRLSDNNTIPKYNKAASFLICSIIKTSPVNGINPSANKQTPAILP